MEHREIARRLSTLVQLDIDAAHAYGRAIAAVEPPAIRRELEAFRDDHERHIKDLSAEVRRLGGSPPPYARDMKGRVIETFTAARSFTGTLGALRAMRMNEQMTQATYARARQWPLPAEARALVERNYADERRHLAAIRDALRRRSCEQTAGLRLVAA
jgi:hypothetical protein